MDKRMYRSNMGNSNFNRNVSRRRPESVSRDDCKGHMHDDKCDGRMFDEKCDEHMHEDKCDGHRHDRKKSDGDISCFPIGMCYVPWQCFRDLYENEFTALANGTLFKELDLKWYGRSCK